MELKKRSKIISAITIVLLSAGIVRFFYICVFKHSEYSEAAERQRVYGTELEAERGNIFDRNMIPLTNRREELLSYSMPNSSIYKIHSFIRYDENSLAKYITGYVRKDGTGETGVEGKYDEYLKPVDVREIVMVRDAKNKPLNGFGYTITETDKKPYDVRLTIDYRYQSVCEEVFRKNNLAGAFVLQDTLNGDITAMGSFPDYRHGHISDYLNSDGGELINRATSAFNLGSVYKMVVAACALEKKIDLDYSYYCTGSIDVTGKQFKCHTNLSGGHGILNMKNAFAKSCNPFFIDLGLEIGMKDLVEFSELFGFGRKTGLEEQGIFESSGNLPDINGIVNDRAIANISIGQGEIMASPLQVTNAVSAVANGGLLLKPNIIESIIDVEGNVIERVKEEKLTRIIKESTAEKLKEYMEEVALTGTAYEGISAYGLSGIYGKTGSAETGKVTELGQVVHSWFSAFFEMNGKTYTLTIFIENGVTLSQSATKVFGEIVSLTSTIQ